MRLTTVASTDPMRDKQALAIAESLLEEIESQAFSYCDPEDANAATATTAAGCATTPQVAGATAGESRYAEPRFDNVGDYHSFTMNGIVDIQNNAIAGLGSYNASVTEVLTGDEMRIDVTVTSGTTSITLTGYRYRFAPRTIP
jgi:MSHA pilin protein MshD